MVAWFPREFKENFESPEAHRRRECKVTLCLHAAGCRSNWHAGKRAATPWRQPSRLPVNAASSRVFPGGYGVNLNPGAEPGRIDRKTEPGEPNSPLAMSRPLD